MAEIWFVAGAIAFMAAGGGHALAAVFDTVRPTFFSPVDDTVRGSTMETSTFRFRCMWPLADDVAPSMWRLWIGFNISHGVGAFVFGLMRLLLARHDFGLVESIDAFRPLTVAVAAAYFVLALRFWFYVPAIVPSCATAFFAIVAALSG